MSEEIEVTDRGIPLPAPNPIDKFAEALAKAQGEMKNAVLNKVNPHFKSRYADLAAVRDATIPVLSAHGLAIVQYTALSDLGLTLKTRIMHVSGQYMESEYPLPIAADKPQVMASAMTYARRYCWTAMCGISSEDDDDAESATRATPKNAAGKTRTPDLSNVRGDLHTSDIQIGGPFQLYNLFGEEEMECPNVRTFLTELGTRVKENAAWWGCNKHTVEWMEKEYLNQMVPGGKEYIETWTRKLRQLAEAVKPPEAG